VVTRLAVIFLAGGGGAVLRYLLTVAWQPEGAKRFPVGTLAVNLLGCLAIGVVMPAMTEPLADRPELRFAIVVGLLGGFTTFSSFAFETTSLLRHGAWTTAAVYLIASNALGLLAAWLGYRLAHAWMG